MCSVVQNPDRAGGLFGYHSCPFGNIDHGFLFSFDKSCISIGESTCEPSPRAKIFVQWLINFVFWLATSDVKKHVLQARIVYKVCHAHSKT